MKSPEQTQGEVVGYARVSTEDQDLKMQITALEKSGIPRNMIFSEKVSGAARRLPERERALKMATRPGWVLRVWKLDRLGRSMRDVVNIAYDLADAGASVQTMDGIDTGRPIVGPLILNVLAAVAEFERAMIAERTKAGMAARKAAGQKFGAKKKINAKLRATIRKQLREKDPATGKLRYTITEIAEMHDMVASTIQNDPALRGLRTQWGISRRGRPPGKKRN